MLTEAIKKYRDAVKGKCKIQVIGDNSQIFTDGLEGNVLLWCDGQEVLLCARPNIAPNQSAQNFEITVLDYDHIQYLKIYADNDVLKLALDATGHAKKDIAYDMLTGSDVANSNTTGSTGDGLYTGHTRPNYEKSLELKKPEVPKKDDANKETETHK